MFEVWSAHTAATTPTVKPFIVPGTLIWVPNLDDSPGSSLQNEKEDFSLAQVRSRSGNVITAQLTELTGFGDYRVIDLSVKAVKIQKLEEKKKPKKFKKKVKELKIELPPCLPANDKIVEDMTELNFTHEAAILHNLKVRARTKNPYTFIGNVLVSINPLQRILEPDDFETSPHPGTIAERAFKKMTFTVSQRRRVLEENESYMTLFHEEYDKDFDTKPLKREVEELKVKLAKEFGSVHHSILISGESGAGKTEAAKRVLCRLVDREGYGEINYCEDQLETFDFQDKLIGATPILESFGNATTHRNPNSSRFGKFLKLWYEPDIDLPDDLCLYGASITTYLLERSRVTFQEEGEKNYRIFYQLLTAPNFKLHKLLGINQAGYKFKYLGDETFTKKDIDKIGYVELRTAFQMAHIGVRSYHIFQVVAAVLHLGNIEFISEKAKEGEVAAIKEPDIKEIRKSAARKSVLRNRMSAKRLRKSTRRGGGGSVLFNPRASFVSLISYADNSGFFEALNTTREDYSASFFSSFLLGVKKDGLKEILTTTKVKVGGEVIVKRINTQAASRRRDALAKHLYASLFDWLVAELNKSLKGEPMEGNEDFTSFIGVLDVFGFEEFEKNGFEQLLINYANEVLLSLFRREILIGEKQLYLEEGLHLSDSDSSGVDLSSSSGNECLELFDGYMTSKKKRVQGLFQVIDGQGKVPSPSEDKMLQTLHKNFIKNKAFPSPHPSKKRECFIIKHYASQVIYSTGTFLDKNDQSLPSEVGDLFKSSKHVIVKTFQFNSAPKKNEMQGLKKKKKKKGRLKGKTTVISSFSSQMNELKDTLINTNCSYIRCVKPNPSLYFNKEAFRLEAAYSLAGSRGLALRHTESKYQRMQKEKARTSKKLFIPKQIYFDSSYISSQLKNLGIYDCVNVLKTGYPTRLPYPNFVKMYSEIIPLRKIPYFKKKSKTFRARMYVSALMYAFNVPTSGYKLGKTKIFFKNGQLENVKHVLKSGLRMSKLSPKSRERKKIMNRFKKYYARRRWKFCFARVVSVVYFQQRLKFFHSIRLIQKFFRKAIAEKKLKDIIKRKRAAVTIQTEVRIYLAKKLVSLLRDEKLMKQKKEEERKRKIQEEREKAERLARENAERLKKEKADRLAKQIAETKAKEEEEKLETERLKRAQEEAELEAEKLREIERREKQEKQKKRELETVDFKSTFAEKSYENNAMRGHVANYFDRRTSFNRMRRTRLRNNSTTEGIEEWSPESKLSTVEGLFNPGTLDEANEEEWKEVELVLLDFDGTDANFDIVDDVDEDEFELMMAGEVEVEVGSEAGGQVEAVETFEEKSRKSTLRDGTHTKPLTKRMRHRKEEFEKAKNMKKAHKSLSGDTPNFADKVLGDLLGNETSTPSIPETKSKKSSETKKTTKRKKTFFKRNKQRKSFKAIQRKTDIRKTKTKNKQIKKLKEKDNSRQRASSTSSQVSLVDRMIARYSSKD